MDALTAFRRAKDEFLARSHQSPLAHGDQEGFAGLAYFDPAPDLVFELPVEPEDGAELTVQTSDGQERTYRRVGRVAFEVDGEAVSLALYDSGHPGYFVPFRDATSGSETYGAGRYLDIEDPGDGTITLDFNYAYNPFCAYNPAYSCPLPPAENWLPVPIRAGELDYAPEKNGPAGPSVST